MMATLKQWISVAFNSPVIEKKRHVWVDYLRGIIIILVVYHHAFLGMVRSGIDVPRFILDANMAAYSFRMPLFFIFSGMFTGLALCSRPIKRLIKSKFNYLLYPYVVWSVLQITLQIIFSDYTNSDGGYHDYIYILYQPKQIAHFWYLPALFNSTMVFIFMKSKVKIHPAAHLVLGIALFLFAPFTNSISMISNWMRFYIFLVIGDTIASLMLRKETQVQLGKPLYLLAVIPLFVAAQYYYFHVIGVRSLENDSANFQVDAGPFVFNELSFLLVSLVGCGTFIVLSFLLQRWGRMKWLRIIGFHSLYIYIMHVIVVGFARVVLVNMLGTQSYLSILVIAVSLGVVVPVVFYNLIGKKYLWFLFSTERPDKKAAELRETPVVAPNVRLQTLPTGVNNI